MDASGEDIGGVLMQEIEGVDHPIRYVYRKLLLYKNNYSTTSRGIRRCPGK